MRRWKDLFQTTFFACMYGQDSPPHTSPPAGPELGLVAGSGPAGGLHLPNRTRLPAPPEPLRSGIPR